MGVYKNRPRRISTFCCKWVLMGALAQARKRHINITFFGVVALRTAPGLSRGQTGFVPGTSPLCSRDTPRFTPYFTHGSPVCPSDKPSLSLGQSRGRGAAEKNYVLGVHLPFSLAICAYQLEFPGAQRLKHFQSRMKCSISLENVNLA